MNISVKKIFAAIVAPVVLCGMLTCAHAGDTYYVYKKGNSSTCDISTKSPSDYNRGSQYSMVASDSTRSGAKKAGEQAGCSSF